MTLHVVYRAAPVGNKRPRPPGFSKWSCLLSFLRAAEACPSVNLQFVCDGPVPEAVGRVMAAFGSVERLGGVGNSRSYRHVVARMAKLDGDAGDVGYLCEDDYLHLPESLRVLDGVAAHLSLGTYVTLYDHPDRYLREDDLRTFGRSAELWNGRYWTAVESTAMTFGASLATIHADRFLLDLAARFTHYPHDRAMWRTIQGLGVRRPVGWVRRPRRRLLSSLPGLATHMEIDGPSAGTHWPAVSAEAHRWAVGRSLPGVEDW